MLAPTLQVLGDALGTTGSVGTEIEVANNRFTGRVIKPVCMGDAKGTRTHEWLKARGIAIDFAASYAYADSISNRALFDMVGHPVAV